MNNLKKYSTKRLQESRRKFVKYFQVKEIREATIMKANLSLDIWRELNRRGYTYCIFS
jgi:hypothetical protein